MSGETDFFEEMFKTFGQESRNSGNEESWEIQEEEKYPLVEQPRYLGTILYDHQRTSIYRMEERELTKTIVFDEGTTIETTMGILGDIPGYGKTMSMATLIARNKMKPTETDLANVFSVSRTTALNPLVKITRKLDFAFRSHFIDATLIVCSTTIMSQWEKTLKMMKGKIRLVRILSKKDVRELDISQNTGKAVVFLCSHTIYNCLARAVKDLVWKRFVFDEVASVKIGGMVEWKACFTWFITATYHMFYEDHNFVTRSRSYIKYLFRYLDRTMIDSLVIKNSEEYIMRSQAMEKPLEIFHRCAMNGAATAVSDFVPQEFLDMVSAGNIDGAISSLGGDPSRKNVMEVVQDKLQRQLDKAKSKILLYSGRLVSGKKEDKELHEKWVDRKKGIKRKIAELRERIEEALASDCLICCSELKRPVLTPCCQNLFCGTCIVSWLTKDQDTHSSCPMCRTDLEVSSLISLSKEGEKEEKMDRKGKDKIFHTSEKPMTKLEHVGDLVSRCEDENLSVIIFSSYDEIFRGVQKILEETGTSYRVVKGAKTTKERIVSSYMEGKTRVLLLNATHNASGIDLQATTDVVLMHNMSSYIENQIVGRAQRLGRKAGRVRVHKFIES